MRLTPLVPVLVFLAAGCAQRPTRTARLPEPGQATVTVLTYNVNFGLAGDRAGLDAIRAANADLVFLQETTARWEASIRSDLGDLYPHMQFHSSNGAGGLAVLAKRPFEDEDGRALKKLRSEGFRTALPEFAPKAKTWRWPTSVVDLTGRLDHVVYDERLDPLSVEVLEEGRSDHFPVLAVFAARDD